MSGEEQTQGVADLKQVADAVRKQKRTENSTQTAAAKADKAEQDQLWQQTLAYIKSGIPPELL